MIGYTIEEIKYEVKVVYKTEDYLKAIAEQSSRGRECYEKTIDWAELKVVLCVKSPNEYGVIIYDYEFDEEAEEEEEGEDWCEWELKEEDWWEEE